MVADDAQALEPLATTEGDVDPDAIAAALREIAAFMTIEGDGYRAQAYERGAGAIEAVQDLPRLVAEERLTELPGIGPSIAGAVRDLATRGTTGVLERLRATWPPVLLELARLPRVGASKARKLYDALSPRDLDELAAMCEAQRVRALPGFGAVSEARLLEAIQSRHERRKVLLLDAARDLGASLAAQVRRRADRVDLAGPARRWIEVVDRVALAAATDQPEAAREALRGHPFVVALTESSPRLAIARLASGALAELHTAPPSHYGVALVRATGSPEHVARLEALAAARGTPLDEIAAPDEPALYAALGLPWLPPEVRDGTDEIDAALAGDTFADLVAIEDVTAAVHCHTAYSDGRASVEQMARAARQRGLSAITITDHSPTAYYAGGVSLDRLEEQWREIDAARAAVDIRILRGTESDILADGRLDYPDDVLARFDIVIASIHSRYGQGEDDMTRRLVTAMRHPLFKIWGHALGRLVLRRDPVPCRFDEVLDAVIDSRAAIEIDGDPRRLDLDPARARLAKARGARFVLSSDAHAPRQLDHLVGAVAMARRARLRRGDVLNTLPPDEFARAVRP